MKGSFRKYSDTQLELYNKKGKHILTMYLDSEQEQDSLFKMLIKQVPDYNNNKDVKDLTPSARGLHT